VKSLGNEDFFSKNENEAREPRSSNSSSETVNFVENCWGMKFIRDDKETPTEVSHYFINFMTFIFFGPKSEQNFMYFEIFPFV
jgi:hypothetical protein